MENSIPWNRYHRFISFSLSESNFKILIVSVPWPCWTHCFHGILLSPCASSATLDRTREECCSLDVFGWKWILAQRMFKAPEGMFFPVQRSDWDAGLVLQDVLSSRMFCWAIFWPFRDIQDFYLTFHYLQPPYSIDFVLYTFINEALNHMMLSQLAIVSKKKLCDSPRQRNG